MNQPKRPEQVNFAGILKLLYQNRKTGVLKIQSAEGELLVHFREGKIVNVDMPRGQEWIIGQYLTEGEVLSERKLLKALKISSEKNLRPEEIIVSKKFMSPDVLRRYMDLYSREVILPLFSKVGLVCSFVAEEPLENRWLPPVSVPFLLKEGEKRTREWPLLAKRIPSANVVYGKDKSFISQVMKDGESNGNPLFSDKVDPELGANERIVYYFVDSKKSVKQLARASGLDLFSTYKALYNLENKFMVKVVSSQALQERRGNPVIPYAIKGLFYAATIVALGLLALNRPGPLKLASGERDIDIELIEKAVQRTLEAKGEIAVETLLLVNMECPDSFEPAIRQGLLERQTAEPLKFTCDPGQGALVTGK